MRFRAPLLLALAFSLACGKGLVDPVGDGGPGDAGPGGHDGGQVCGDGVREGTEECDNGAANGPNAGCERDCTFSCIPFDAVRGDSHCDPHDPCKGVGHCGDNHVCSVVNPLANGADCGGGKICRGGACQAPVCGDGIVTAPEECDDGVNDGSHGCDSTCHFVCVSTDTARNCTPTDPCQGASTCDDGTHLCSPRTPLGDGTSCGTGMVCQSGHCVASACSSAADCTPCASGVCKGGSCVASVCGDGCRDASRGEQCDDGNLVNLDGCDSSCRFEQNQRAVAVAMRFDTDAYCTVNALGGAIGSSAQSTVKSQIDTAITNGTMNVMFAVLGLADTTGQNGSLSLGAVTGDAYAAPVHETYNGNNDLDWWYTVGAADLDSNRVPKSQLSATITSTNLATDPNHLGHTILTLVLGSGPVELKASGVKLKASIGSSSAPTESTSGVTPGHTLDEHLDRALVSFASMGNGELCGNVSAASIQAAPVPATLQSGGSAACDEGYGSSNDMLDVIVGGCTKYVFPLGTFTIFAATNPDQVDPAAPAAGAGGPYSIGMNGTQVSSCSDRGGAPVDLTTCLNAAAYSSFLTFATDRVILK
jgi:cysteine-rich repeat protein